MNNYSELPLRVKKNDDLKFMVTLDYDIPETATPTFIIEDADKTKIDWSNKITKVTSKSFFIHVLSSDLRIIGEIIGRYEVVIDLGGGSKDFLHGGDIEILYGI